MATLRGKQLDAELEISDSIGNSDDLTDYPLRFHVPGSGAESVDQSHTGDTGVQAGGPDSWQSFTTSKTGYLTAVSVELRNVTTPATNCTVRIYEGEGATGAVLATETGLSFDDDVLTKVPLSDLPYLENATKYTIRVWGTNWGWHVTSDSSYAGGRFSNASTQDGFFETYMSDGNGLFLQKSTSRFGIHTSSPTADTEIVGTSFLNGTVIGGLGHVDGFVVGYSDATTTSISAGSIEANGKHYTLASDTTHAMTSLATGFDFHYVYIDDSASTSPTAVIIDSTTEPAWSDSKRGFYNGDDRRIGVVSSTIGASTLSFFHAEGTGKMITYKSGSADPVFPNIASAMNPTGAWQTPNINESSVVCPIGSTSLFCRTYYQNAGAICRFYAASSEMAVVLAVSVAEIYAISYNTAQHLFQIALGSSRNIKITGHNDDDNVLAIIPFGYTTKR